MTTRILLVDDHAVVRSGLRMLLENDRDVEIIGEASDGQAAIDLAQPRAGRRRLIRLRGWRGRIIDVADSVGDAGRAVEEPLANLRCARGGRVAQAVNRA